MAYNDPNIPSSPEGKYFAYVYRDTSGRVKYAGYGTNATRAYPVGHNSRVVENGNEFEVLIVGPYRDKEEALNVEAALISAHDSDSTYSSEWNQMHGNGLKFRHLGVPSEFGSRRSQPAMTIKEIGLTTGGALIVLSSLETQLKSGHEKLTPRSFADDVVLNNIREYWYVKKFLQTWVADPNTSPKVLVGVQGPPKSRIIIGSVDIDIDGWKTTPVAKHDPSVHRIPILNTPNLDARELRGRSTSDIVFGMGKALTFIWVDGGGEIRHAKPSVMNR